MKNYVLGLFCGLIFNLYGQEKPSPYGAVTNFFNVVVAALSSGFLGSQITFLIFLISWGYFHQLFLPFIFLISFG